MYGNKKKTLVLRYHHMRIRRNGSKITDPGRLLMTINVQKRKYGLKFGIWLKIKPKII